MAGAFLDGAAEAARGVTWTTVASQRDLSRLQSTQPQGGDVSPSADSYFRQVTKNAPLLISCFQYISGALKPHGYRLAAGTSTHSTSTDSSVGFTQVCGSRPGNVTVSPW